MAKRTTLRALVTAALAGDERSVGSGKETIGRLIGIDRPAIGGIARAGKRRAAFFN